VCVLTDGLHLLGSLYAVLHLPEPFEVVVLLLGDLELQCRHFLVLALCHLPGHLLQSLAGHLERLADIAAVGDTQGQADDTGEFHHVHATAAEHHHPALVGAHAKGKQQTEHLGKADGTAKDGGLGESLHGRQQAHQTVVDGRKAHRQQLVDE
jgi:hypothetical protein